MKRQQLYRTSRNKRVCHSGCGLEHLARGHDSELNPDSRHSDIYVLNARMASLTKSLLQLALCLQAVSPKAFDLCPSPALSGPGRPAFAGGTEDDLCSGGGTWSLSLDHVSPFIRIIELLLFTLTARSAALVHRLWDVQGLQNQRFLPQPPVGVHLEVRNGL